ncbi:heterokaryon incompatibility protein-domain-containing protein [Astrocystis sublimbata]|nr:heterokaryon incompatibility protein-domain-containing protein [Astrocystis sublimbata]
MRLLHTQTRQMREFASCTEKYAILSHTWGLDEVTLWDWQNLSPADLESKEGYRKIDFCCKQALQDGYDWVWVDTCCIDKTSSAELSEAINSMFRWYKYSDVCYAHLTDVDDNVTQDTLSDALSKSRWFTRGWTLQELISPAVIIFFSRNWQRLTSKYESRMLLSEIIGIERRYLDPYCLGEACAAKKMSWAALRETSRVEDIAYCLLGIFNVNMPLLYGEGKKAFQRLQEEILKGSPEDHTLFAWGEVASSIRDLPYRVSKKDAARLKDIKWESPKVDEPLYGLLAESPFDFKDSGRFRMAYNLATSYYDQAPGRGVTLLPQILKSRIRIQLPMLCQGHQLTRHWSNPQIATLHEISVACLLCYHEEAPDYLVGIPVVLYSSVAIFSRTETLLMRGVRYPGVLEPLIKRRRMLTIGRPSALGIGTGDVILRRNVCGPNVSSGDGTDPQNHYIPEPILTVFGTGRYPRNGLIGELQYHCRATSSSSTTKQCHFGVKLERMEGVYRLNSPTSIFATIVALDREGIEAGANHLNIPTQNTITLSMPLDGDILNLSYFIFVAVKTERISIDVDTGGYPCFVDVLDIVVTRKGVPDTLLQDIRAIRVL